VWLTRGYWLKISGEISGQQMVDSGRSEGEDSDDGGLDSR